MTDPQYVKELANLYTSMHNHPGIEKPLPLTEKFGPVTRPDREIVNDDEPKWKKLLRKSFSDKKEATVADVPRDDISDAEEGEEENSKANLVIKLTHELMGEAKHDAAAAKALYILRDLVK